MFTNERHFLGKWREAMVSLLMALYREFPEQAFVDPDENGNFEEYSRLSPTAPLYTYVKGIPVLIHKIIATVFTKDLQNDELFDRLRDQLLINLAQASNIPIEERRTTSKNFVLPQDQSIADDGELLRVYLSGTPFLDIFLVEIPLHIPEAVRFEHTHILAGTGHGKTQTLQFLIAGDIEVAVREKRSVVVVDSQGDLLQTLMHSEYFADPSLRERFIYIDPQDMERPVGLNLFDIDLSAGSIPSPQARETILNNTVELYDFFFGSLLGAELTQKQGLVFRYLAVLMMRIPGANVHTLRELMEDGEKFRPHMKTLQGSARIFFETRFFDRAFNETKKQILNRLWGVLSNQSLDRMMSAPKNSVDLFKSLQDGSIVFINTAKDFLGEEGSTIFSRMFVALLGQALMRRAIIEKHARTPTYIYIDEAERIVDATLTRMLTQVRKYKGAITFAHQHLDQLEPSIRAGVMANTSIKLAGGVSAKDARALSEDFRCTADFLLEQKKGRNEANFACFARNVTDQAVALSIPLGFLESQGTLSDAGYEALVESSRQKYGVVYVEDIQNGEAATDSPSDWLGEAPVEIEADLPTPTPQLQPAPLDQSKEIVITRAPVVQKIAEPRDIGGGGVKHKYIEHLIKELGEERGFRASVEETVHDGAGRVDVILRRETISLAFEISVTTTRDHELGNIEKCLALPFTHVVMLASHQKHLKSLSLCIGKGLEDDEKKRVSFLLPEDLPGFLDGYPMAQVQKEKTVKGYTVRSRIKEADLGEALARRRAIAAVVARSIQD
ncbi:MULTISPECIES: type IV secretory system conjugative DNA transfer family protein [unclassified Polaromonas]|uniref:type IV secretory system conjugative DNA transfer family protein n=1 Tax=unclassified Polaromonas TaxID=2638319 RepID=UPI000F083BAF|nr:MULTISPECIES: DUF87 domain-containing protein [unclassified Polaromonas]AYQ27629.1 DUF87 domain-containing protein [Polaromonas sp. SP1]QGJ17527.1 DUF87 domain-containing protein [Polaromonas sp. Pch-P]